MFGWSRETVEVGLAERRTGVTCLGAQSAFSGRKRWEDQHPQAAAALRSLAEAQAQQDPTFRTLAGLYAVDGQSGCGGAPRPRLLQEAGARPQYHGDHPQSAGLSLTQSPQSQTAKEDCSDRRDLRESQKKTPQAVAAGNVKRWSMDCKATVQLGEFSRGGLTRGDVKACDHDLGCQAKYIPCGVVDEDTGQLSITFGSSAKTSDFIVETVEARWQCLATRTNSAPPRSSSSKWITAPKAAACARSFSIAWCSLPTRLANPSSCCTTRPITASIIRLNDAGGF